jgi:hypothetical protein
MALPALAADLVAIVIRGNFRPVDISPKQLFEQKLIGENEYDEATFEVRIPSEVSVFDAGWLRCQANPDALQLMTEQEAEHERLRDLAVAVLRSAPDTAVSQLGINRHVHFPVDDTRVWNAIGDNLVHNDIWGDVLTAPGMRSAVFWSLRTDHYGGRIQVQVEPSFAFPPGVYFSYNDHYDLTRTEKLAMTRAEARALNRPESDTFEKEKVPIAIEILSENWEGFIGRTTTALERVWQQGRQ